MPVPSPEEQIEFLQKVQRLMTEGLFVASYKFALLRALADLAVLKGDDSGDELELQVTDIAAQFIELYWRQTRPFCATGHPDGEVLRQNTGKQAAIVQESTIRLKPGVAYCLRNFYGILRNLIEGAWINYVRSVNLPVLGHATDIGSFLFGAERSTLEAFRPFLREIQTGTCFYCLQPLRQGGDVDHFIPWLRYPVDLGHNFVLAHNNCNNDKAAHLAAEGHLSNWMDRNDRASGSFRQFCSESRLPDDPQSSLSIARWAYTQTAAVKGLVWVERGTLAHLGTGWEKLLINLSIKSV